MLTWSIYIAVTFVVLLVALSLLHLRVRAEVAPGRKQLFFGLGRSGVLIDFSTGTKRWLLWGMRGRSSHLVADKSDNLDSQRELKKPKAKAPKTGRRLPPARDLIRLLPRTGKAAMAYGRSLLRALELEELRADVTAGFDSPDLTGQAFGYYQAALAAAPQVIGRLHYTPDFSGASFAAEGTAGVSMPLYRLIFSTMWLIVRLPIIEIMKLVIGRRKDRGHVK